MSNKEKSLVEEALLQMKNLEEAVTENAKGILASTMKEEIKELVKESLEEEIGEGMEMESSKKEEESTMAEQEMELDIDDTEEESDNDDEEEIELDTMSMDSEESDDDFELDMDDEEVMLPLDLTGASDEEILKVFKAMGDEDGIIVKKDGEEIHLKDENSDVEYKIDLGESEEEESIDEMMDDDSDAEGLEDEFVFEIEMDDEDDDDEEEMMSEEKMTVTPKGEGMGKPNFKYPSKMKGGVTETEDIEEMTEGEMTVKPKGEGMGKPNFKYPSKLKGGVTETEDIEEMSEEWGGKKGDDSKSHKDYETTEEWGGKKGDDSKSHKDYETSEEWGGKKGDDSKSHKDYETTEAARTKGNGRRNSPQGGLPKMKVIPNSALAEEVESLRAKNDEYRKALNIFKDKLNEVAVFNSNLAYAVRLFTENSTTKQEKINILRRFDNVETLKESKALYKTVKDELSSQSVVTESVETKLQQTPTAGSSTTLIESKTYENPQFLRMKDLMGKINK